jgi:hypothetical protein
VVGFLSDYESHRRLAASTHLEKGLRQHSPHSESRTDLQRYVITRWSDVLKFKGKVFTLLLAVLNIIPVSSDRYKQASEIRCVSQKVSCKKIAAS